MSVPTIERHLAQWGLRRWPDDASYDAWQRRELTMDYLRQLRRAAERRRDGGPDADAAFYDLAASPDALPVLHSQRYGYYRTLAPAVANALKGASRVLDVGCGVGILTTWYAARFPDAVVLGLDRSSQSLDAARRFARTSGIENVQFQHGDAERQALPEGFDTVVATQALFQSETDPGLPSRDWSTFERDRDAHRQQRLEQRTGIGACLDRVVRALPPSGRVVFFEKAAHAGRRVLFQRALAARGLAPVETPTLLTFVELGEAVEEGPLFVLRRASSRTSPAALGLPAFDEDVTQDDEQAIHRCAGRAAACVYARLPKDDVRSEIVDGGGGGGGARFETGRTGGGLCYAGVMRHGVCEELILGAQALRPFMTEMVKRELRAGRAVAFPSASTEHGAPEETPVFEHHGPAAERVWRELPERAVVREQTDEEADGRQRHIEYGRCAGNFRYLYWANTYDQRQIVMVEDDRRALLEEYYAESVGER